MSLIFSTLSHGVKISVTPEHRLQESNPQDDFYVWAYHVQIENQRNDAVQLLTRHWEITDGNGLCQVVEGDGVIGKQPIIAPNQIHAYSSWTTLTTNSGIMGGHYGMVDALGVTFNVRIPTFSLDSPEAIRMAN
jgi:ApaG protein